MNEYELIKEANKRGYRKGTKIHYYPERQSEIDYLEGEYFEMDEKGNLNAYSKPKHERFSFDDNRHDTIYFGETKSWVKIF